MRPNLTEEYIDYVELKPEVVLRIAKAKGIANVKFVKISAPEGTKYRFALTRHEHWMLVREGEKPVSAGFVGVGGTGKTFLHDEPSESLRIGPDKDDEKGLQEFFQAAKNMAREPETPPPATGRRKRQLNRPVQTREGLLEADLLQKAAASLVDDLLDYRLPRSIFEELIEEAGRWDYVQQEWAKAPKEFIDRLGDPAATLRQLVRADPGTDWPEPPYEERTRAYLGDAPYPAPKRIGPYSQWIVKRFVEAIRDENEIAYPSFMEEDLPKVTADLKAFERIKSKLPQDKRNIVNIGSFTELWELVEPFREELEAKAAEGEADKLYDKDGWVILVPKTQQASCAYGAGTRWCTAGRDSNYFNRYNKQGPLFIIIHKGKDEAKAAQLRKEIKDKRAWVDSSLRAGKPSDISKASIRKVSDEVVALEREMETLDIGDKWQFHFPSNQFMDAMDRQINLAKFLDEHPFVGPVIAAYLDKNDKLDEKSLELLDLNRLKEMLKSDNNVGIRFSKVSSHAQIRMLATDPSMVAIANADRPDDAESFDEKGVHVIIPTPDIEKLFEKDERRWVDLVLSGHAADHITHGVDEFSGMEVEDDLTDENKKKIQELIAAGVDEDEVHREVATAYAQAYESGEEYAYYTAIFKAIDREFPGRKWATAKGLGEGISVFIAYSTFLDMINGLNEQQIASDGPLHDIVLEFYHNEEELLSYRREVGRDGPYVEINKEYFNERVSEVLNEIDVPEQPVAQSESLLDEGRGRRHSFTGVGWWVTPTGEMEEVYTNHGDWAQKYLDDQEINLGDGFFDDDGNLLPEGTNAYCDYLSNEGWLRVALRDGVMYSEKPWKKVDYSQKTALKDYAIVHRLKLEDGNLTPVDLDEGATLSTLSKETAAQIRRAMEQDPVGKEAQFLQILTNGSNADRQRLIEPLGWKALSAVGAFLGLDPEDPEQNRTDMPAALFLKRGIMQRAALRQKVQGIGVQAESIVDALLEVKSSKANVQRFVKQYGATPNSAEDIFKRFTDLEQRMPNKDIFGYATFNDLSDAMKRAESTPSANKAKKTALDADTVKVYDDGNVLVVAPKSHASCKHWGGGTGWCISTSNKKWWSDESQKGIIFIVWNRKLEKAWRSAGTSFNDIIDKDTSDGESAYLTWQESRTAIRYNYDGTIDYWDRGDNRLSGEETMEESRRYLAHPEGPVGAKALAAMDNYVKSVEGFSKEAD